MSERILTAMVLAAGLGLRMRPITLTRPKPLVAVGGSTLLARILDHLRAAAVERVVINVHHLPEQIEAAVARRRDLDIVISREETLLETGGGVRQALPLLGGAPFFVINGDVLWRDGAEPTLSTLARAWNGRAMDALLLLHPTATAIGYAGAGDFRHDENGRLIRRGQDSRAPYLFAGLQILTPRLFTEAPAGAFSLNRLYDRAIAAGRGFGVVHLGGWCHVGTPADIPLAERFLAAAPPAAAAVAGD
jgi:MurNAc alpha-1-phosphate uridylyltransferase